MSLRKWISAGLLALGLAAPAQAGNAISGTPATTLFKNLTSIGVQTNVAGDDDSSAVLRLFVTTSARYKAGGVAAFDSGMTMVRRVGGGGASDAASGNIYDGRIAWMAPGDSVYWFLKYDDAGGGSGQTAVATMATNTIPNCPTSGPRWYVNQSTGNDSWDGTSPTFISGTTGPKLTITSALAAMDADATDGANGGIVVAPGIYREKFNINFGTDAVGTYRFIAGDGTNPDSTIIDGSLPDSQTPFNTDWTAVASGSADSAYKAVSPRFDSVSVVVADWDEYVHKKTSVQEIWNDAMGELSGWAVNGDTMYVKLRAKGALGLDARNRRFHIGYQGAQSSLFQVRKRNWIFKKLTLRFAGGNAGNNHGFELGTTGIRASGTVIDSCKWYGIAGRGVYLPIWAAGGGADSVTVSRCTARGLGIGGMNYQAAKLRQEENSNIVQLAACRLANIYRNSWDNTANCMAVGPGGIDETDTTSAHSLEVSYNTIYWTSDDGLEIDGCHAINAIVYNNTVRKTLNSISTSPIFTGAAWFMFNTCSNYGIQQTGGGHKMGGSGGDGQVFLYNNTFSTRTQAGSGARSFATNSASTETHMTYRNNILVGSADSQVGSATISMFSITDVTTNSFNYNLTDTLQVERAALFNSAAYSIGTAPATSTWQSTRGWDKNGPGRAHPLFADSAHANFSPTASSPAVNQGMRINGVNTDHRGIRYRGLPDIGAGELGWDSNRRSYVSRGRGVHFMRELY